MNAFTFPGMVPGAPYASGLGQPTGVPGIGHNGGPLLDAAMLGFNDAEQRVWNMFVSQVARIENEVFAVQYPNIRYPDLIPVDTSGNQWTQSILYYSSDRVGQAQWANAQAQDVPLVGMTRNAFATSVQMAWIGYGYNEEELAIAEMMGGNLTNDKADICRRGAEEFIDRVALFGDPAMGFSGLINSAAVTAGAVPADGTGTSTYFAAKTSAQILRDINAALTGIWTSTNSVEMADTLLMPQSVFAELLTRPRADTTDTTVMEFLQKANIYTAETGRQLRIRGLYGLNNAGAGSTGRIVAYRRSPDVLKLYMPMPFQFRPPWRKGPLTYEVPGIFRLGGLDIRRPASMRYLDGVSPP